MGLEVKGLTWYRAALTAAYHAGVRPPRDRCDRTRPVPHIRLIDPIGGINLVRNDGAVIDQTQGHGTGDHGSTHRWAALSRGSPTDLRERSPAFEGVAIPSLRKPTVAYWAQCRASGPSELRGLFHPLDSRWTRYLG